MTARLCALAGLLVEYPNPLAATNAPPDAQSSSRRRTRHLVTGWEASYLAARSMSLCLGLAAHPGSGFTPPLIGDNEWAQRGGSRGKGHKGPRNLSSGTSSRRSRTPAQPANPFLAVAPSDAHAPSHSPACPARRSRAFGAHIKVPCCALSQRTVSYTHLTLPTKRIV